TTSAGAFRMNQSSPKMRTARSSSSPITGMKSGMTSIGKARYAAIPPSTSFCCVGTRGSRARPHTRRAYVGSLRATSIASPMLRGRFMPLATVYLPLRESCPQRRDRGGSHHIAVGRPKTNQVVRAAVRDGAQLDVRRRLLRHAGSLRERITDVVGRDRLLSIVDDEPQRAAPEREPREIGHGARHEDAVRDDDLPAVGRLPP